MKNRHTLALGALLATTLVAAACGGDAGTKAGSSGAARVVAITMTDMAYNPTAITVTKGETVTFRFQNNGEAIHEAVIGDAEYQMDHAASMTGSTMTGSTMTTMSDHGDGMDHAGRGADNMVTVKPGKSGEMRYRFDEGGTILIGCHQPGHYEAGMKAAVNVS